VLAASSLEPCSNALLEALNSGLPTIFLDGSGHNELVRETRLFVFASSYFKLYLPNCFQL
jgi:hypothetical protein